MIIFDLDALADDKHRQHFIDPTKNREVTYQFKQPKECLSKSEFFRSGYWENNGEKWHPDYQAYYDACDRDEPIKPTLTVYSDLRCGRGYTTVIWSGRCESAIQKTEAWLEKEDIYYDELKMRPIDNNSPQEELFEEWLNKEVMLGPFESKTLVDFVFSAHKLTIQMFRRRGIFVFDCGQEKE